MLKNRNFLFEAVIKIEENYNLYNVNDLESIINNKHQKQLL